MQKKHGRKLALHRETIKHLDRDELSQAAGGYYQGWSQLCSWFPTNCACTTRNPACGSGYTYAGTCIDATCGCAIY